jgi:YHS domain-containing protein
MNTDKSYQKDVDPVCGMQVDPHKTDLTAEYDGQTYFFCAENCRKAFENQPRKYLAISKDTKRKGNMIIITVSTRHRMRPAADRTTAELDFRQ